MFSARIITLMTMFLLSTDYLYAESLQAGYVKSIKGDADTFSLLHNAKRSSPVLLTMLFSGDVIEIRPDKKKGAELLLWIDEKELLLQAKDFPYKVKIARGATTIPGNAFRMAQAFFIGLQQRSVKTTAMIGRGWLPPLSMPAVMSKPGSIIAGKRSLFLQWSKARGPYRVELLHQGIVVKSATTNKLSISLDPVMLNAGSYELRVLDSEERSRLARLTVVAEAPVLPQELNNELASSSLSTEMKQTLYMVWLIDQDKRWKHEAYQTLCAEPQEHAALLLCKSLFDGKAKTQ